MHSPVTDETAREVRTSARGRRVLRAVHVTGPAAIDAARRAAANCDGVLLDSRTADRLGGTGLTHDWSISAEIVRTLGALGRPVILAGGLHPGDVVAAVEVVRPDAVDVNSGVEAPAGDKDADSCAVFVSAARNGR